jgi:flagellar FliL protein
MKKNLITVITLALVLVNLVLTVILTITVVPEAKQANELITKVCSAIDLDLQAGSATSTAAIPIDQIDVYNIADNLTINLKKGEDGKQHYAIVTIAISMDKENKDYDDLYPQVSSKEELIKAEVNTVLSSYTLEDLQDNQAGAQEELLAGLQQMFGSSFIVGVGFSTIQFQ